MSMAPSVSILHSSVAAADPHHRQLRRMAYLDRRMLLLEADEAEFPHLAWAICDVGTFLMEDSISAEIERNRSFVRRWLSDGSIARQVYETEPSTYFKPDVISDIKATLSETKFPD